MSESSLSTSPTEPTDGSKYSQTSPVFSSESSRGNRFRFLEAGRGVASLWVLFFHSLGAFPADSLPGVLLAFRSISQWGWLGVHVFFAISGWCIAERVAKGRRDSEAGWHFAAERCLRIYPTYWAVLFLTVGIRFAAVPFNTARLSETVPVDWLSWFGSVTLLSPFLGRSLYILVSWSLLYELGFYFSAACGLWALRRRLKGATLLFVIGSLLCVLPWSESERIASLPFLRMWPEFFVGVAAWWASRRGHWLEGSIVLIVVFALTVFRPDDAEAGRLTALGTAVVLALAWRWDNWLGSAPSIRLLTSVGGFSYSLYLIHVPLISPFFNLVSRWIPTKSAGFVAVWIFAIVLALLGARCLNRFVEAPVERWRRRAI